ncbi:MAG: type II toxin-antitoxin system RelE/ParE family toxin [Chlamydiae bacterium]|nr:type II toxin-antitoxin system RelE/ParE family toxin [Chlamydiota bacterium]
MKRKIIQTTIFAKEINTLIRKGKILLEDFETFKKLLAEHPEKGNLIQGTGGVRKIRLKSVSKGKSGGFRICYFDDPEKLELYLMWIYPKNEQENLSSAEKKELKELTDIFKRKSK